MIIPVSCNDKHGTIIGPEDWAPGVVAEIFSERVYRFGFDKLEDSNVVIDLGANLGGFSILAAWHGARVYAYEPDRANYELLCENVARNTFPGQVTCLQTAVWGERCTIHLVPSGSASRVVETGWPIGEKAPPSVKMEAITLADTLDGITGDVGFLKLDVEAAEFAIFEAASEETIDRFRHIALEFHGVRAGTEEERYGGLMTRLARTHCTTAMGHPHRGGYIWATRYH